MTPIPTFPNATYWIHRGEFDDAMHPNARNAASYLERNFAPLAREGRVRWVGDGERLDGIRIFETPGHTRHHLSIGIDDGDGRLLLQTTPEVGLHTSYAVIEQRGDVVTLVAYVPGEVRDADDGAQDVAAAVSAALAAAG